MEGCCESRRFPIATSVPRRIMGRKLAVPAPLLYQLLIICSKTAHLEGGRIDRPVRTV